MALIIAEKPSVARKITQFLSKGEFRYYTYKRKVRYYSFTLNNETFYVVSALGHLYTLSDKNSGWRYPTFSYRWVPAYIEDKITAKKYYIELIKKFKNENYIIVATDYDIEGELIGYNILRFALGRKNSYRMIFSAITPKDILRAFYNKSSTISLNFAIAGETRHIIDWLYGINLSRALTHAIRHYLKRVTLSIGRVQGPTLKLIFEREIEIRNFIPEEYYVLYINTKKENNIIKFKHIRDKFKSKEEASGVKKKIGSYLTVKSIKTIEEKLMPPHPYNLTDLQTDAYKFYKITPKQTLEIAQRLYENGYISYPRTSSQKLPETIDFRYIINNLKKVLSYRIFSILLLRKSTLKPNNGKKYDIHPAIHPTGIIPKSLSKREWLIYDLVARRFLATFMDHAVIEKMYVTTEEDFYYDYKKVRYKGWMLVYWLWLKNEFKDIEFNIGERLPVIKIQMQKRKTRPPARYNPASLVRKMEEIKIGTKTTRAEIVQTLYKRNYIKGRSIKITELGEKIIEIFDKYLPDILDIILTRKLEENIEKIEKGNLNLKTKVIEETIEIVKNTCSKVKQRERELGRELYNVYKKLKEENIS
ncbi:MAG TPA: DNA topoisomerase I [Candidatus Nanopusillus sp.]|nr:DNA topoisomerase I [Candidatus Nanopusillus sp.]